jgi:UDP-N-acetylglucosamine:LPS N-acetylglucosamine transferase
MEKVLFIASTGGHLDELLQLKGLFERCDYYIITERTGSTGWLRQAYPGKVNYLLNVTKHQPLIYLFGGLFNIVKSLVLYVRLHPRYIISTGTHTAVPMCFFGHLFGSRIIWIETFANVTTRTLAGRLVYPYADLFLVQWESMKELYPRAEYGGWIY